MVLTLTFTTPQNYSTLSMVMNWSGGTSGVAVNASSGNTAVATVAANIGIGVSGTFTATIVGAGTALITITQGGAHTSKSLVVNPIALSITANSQSKTYGTTQSTTVTGSTAFTSSGLRSGDSIASVTLTYSNGNAATNAVGIYTCLLYTSPSPRD